MELVVLLALLMLLLMLLLQPSPSSCAELCCREKIPAQIYVQDVHAQAAGEPNTQMQEQGKGEEERGRKGTPAAAKQAKSLSSHIHHLLSGGNATTSRSSLHPPARKQIRRENPLPSAALPFFSASFSSSLLLCAPLASRFLPVFRRCLRAGSPEPPALR